MEIMMCNGLHTWELHEHLRGVLVGNGMKSPLKLSLGYRDILDF